MIRAIVDEGVPADLPGLFTGTELHVAAFPPQWRSSLDKEIIALASSAGFDWLITCDKQMPFQQNLARSPLAVLVLPTYQIPELTRILPALVSGLSTPTPGTFLVLGAGGEPEGKPVAHRSGPRRRKD